MIQMVSKWISILVLACWFGTALAKGEIDAVLEWSSNYQLSLPVSGRVTQVSVEVGDRVKQGDELVRLDTQIQIAERDRAKAIVQQHQLEEQEALRELERAQELFDRTVLSERDLQVAKIDHASALAVLRTAQSELVQAEVHLVESVLMSPVDGIVTRVAVNPGQAVANGVQITPMVVVAVDSPMLAVARVPIERLRSVREGDSVNVELPSGSLRGTVIRLGIEPAVYEQGIPLFELSVEFVPSNDIKLNRGTPVRLTPVSH